MKSNLVSIHPSDASHYNFIKSTWLKSFFLGSSRFCENMTSEVYYEFHPQVVERILKRSKCLVAQSRENPDVTVGYIVYEEPSIVHYLYVKHQFTGFGVAKLLFKESGIGKKFSYTHRTGNCVWIIGATKREKDSTGKKVQVVIEGKYPQAVYIPYKAFY
jgi:hypothetical protein